MPCELIGAGVEFTVAQGGGFALDGDALGEGLGGVLEPAAKVGMGRGDGNRRGAQRLGGLLGVQQRQPRHRTIRLSGRGLQQFTIVFQPAGRCVGADQAGAVFQRGAQAVAGRLQHQAQVEFGVGGE
nr:hypothetical protein [Chromobacterium haemolyticum]